MTEQGVASRRVATVVDAVDEEPEAVRDALDPIAADGRVTEGTVEHTVSDTAKLLATAETRVELAEIAYDDAAAAADIDDAPVMGERLDAFESRLDAVTDRSAALGPELPKPDTGLGSPDELYKLGLDLRDVATRAQGVARTADELTFDLEQFESWVDSPPRRHDEFGDDVELVEESLADLADAVAGIDDADAPGAAWADATMRARVLDLLLTDLRAEFETLERLAERQDATVPPTLHERVGAAERELGRLRTRLGDQGEPAWREQFADELYGLTEGLSEMAPPVDWGAVDELVSEQRAAIGRE